MRDVVVTNRTPTRAIDHAASVSVAVRALEDKQSTWRPAEILREMTTPRVLQQELRIRDIAEVRLAEPPSLNNAALTRSTLVLDHAQAELAAAVAGDSMLVLAVGPAGTGKTTALAPAVEQLQAEGRAVFGVALSPVAAEVLSTATGSSADTLDKLLVEHRKLHGPGEPYRLAPGATIVVDLCRHRDYADMACCWLKNVDGFSGLRRVMSSA